MKLLFNSYFQSITKNLDLFELPDELNLTFLTKLI